MIEISSPNIFTPGQYSVSGEIFPILSNSLFLVSSSFLINGGYLNVYIQNLENPKRSYSANFLYIDVALAQDFSLSIEDLCSGYTRDYCSGFILSFSKDNIYYKKIFIKGIITNSLKFFKGSSTPVFRFSSPVQQSDILSYSMHLAFTESDYEVPRFFSYNEGIFRNTCF